MGSLADRSTTLATLLLVGSLATLTGCTIGSDGAADAADAPINAKDAAVSDALSADGGSGGTPPDKQGDASPGTNVTIPPVDYDGGTFNAPMTLDVTDDAGANGAEPAVAMDDDGNALLLWSEAAFAWPGDRNVWMARHGDQGWSSPAVLARHAKSPEIAMAGHGLGAWSALGLSNPYVSGSPYSVELGQFNLTAGLGLPPSDSPTASMAADEDPPGQPMKFVGAPRVSILPSGKGIFEYFEKNAFGTMTRETAPFSFSSVGANVGSRHGSNQQGWGVIDERGDEIAAWGIFIQGVVGAMSGPEIFPTANVFSIDAFDYAMNASGEGLLAAVQRTTFNSANVVAYVWGPGAVLGGIENIATVSLSNACNPKCILGASIRVFVDPSGAAVVAWSVRDPDGSTSIMASRRAVTGGPWDVPTLLAKTTSGASKVALAGDSSGDAFVAWNESAAAGAGSLVWSMFRPAAGWMTSRTAVAASGWLPNDFRLSAGDHRAVLAWSAGGQVYASTMP